MKPINSLSDALKDLVLPQQHKPSLPSPKETPPPEAQKVAASEGKIPVNRQARLIIAPANCWTYKPIPVIEPSKEPPEVAELRAQLKTERNVHAETRDELGQCRGEIRALRTLIDKLRADVIALKLQTSEQASTIHQLEDLKL